MTMRFTFVFIIIVIIVICVIVLHQHWHFCQLYKSTCTLMNSAFNWCIIGNLKLTSSPMEAQHRAKAMFSLHL